MKFLLTMIICTSVYQQCMPPHTLPETYNTHYECVIAGYNESIKKAKEIGPRDMNEYGTIIKFFCLQEKTFLKKVNRLIPYNPLSFRARTPKRAKAPRLPFRDHRLTYRE